MSLIALIDKHKTDLAVSWEAGTQEVVDKYRAFGSELVQLPSFTYSRENMKVAVSHMMDLGFNRHARYDVAAYAMRRSALEAVPDVSAREEIWRLSELAHLGSGEDLGGPRLKEATADYVHRVGKAKVEQYLLMVQEGFKAVATEIDAVYQIAKVAHANPKLDKKAKLIADQAAENHGQHIALEKMQLDDILEIVRSL